VILPLDVIRFVTERTGHPLNDDEGITFGPRTRVISGITVAFTLTAEVVAAAVKAGHNCIIHHEWLTFFSAYFGDKERHDLSWPVNQKRIALLAKHELTCMRIHGSADELYIFDETARQLGLNEGIGTDGSAIYCRKVFKSPKPTFGELIDHVKRATGMPALRTTLDSPSRPVSRVGMPWGGMGLFINIAYVQGLIDAGADTLICGETDNHAFRVASESGLAVIETSHEVSEVQGLRVFAEALQAHFKLNVRFVDTPCIWKVS